MSRVYVGRLSYQAREKDVERFFRGFGRIRDINLKNGFGFVVSCDSRHFECFRPRDIQSGAVNFYIPFSVFPF